MTGLNDEWEGFELVTESNPVMDLAITILNQLKKFGLDLQAVMLDTVPKEVERGLEYTFHYGTMLPLGFTGKALVSNNRLIRLVVEDI